MLTGDACAKIQNPYYSGTMSSKKLLLFPVLFIFSTISCAYADFADTQYSWYHDSIEKLHTE